MTVDTNMQPLSVMARDSPKEILAGVANMTAAPAAATMRKEKDDCETEREREREVRVC